MNTAPTQLVQSSASSGMMARVIFVIAAIAAMTAIAAAGPCHAQGFSNVAPPEPVTGFEVPGNTTASPSVTANVVTEPPTPAVSSSTQTLGATASASKRLFDVLRSGGVLMIPIAICSFILVVFIFERFISLRKARIIPGPFSTRFLDQLENGDFDRASALSLCQKNNSPIAHVFAAGIAKWGRPSVEVEQAVLDEGERTSTRLRSYLRLINGIATVCPLLGMLGTVLGMIHAFDAIATVSEAVGDPKAMIATGISQALLTTAAGMTVAIPALIAYLFFSSRVDKHVMEIDRLGMKVVNLISAESLSLGHAGTRGSSSATAKTTTKKSTNRAA